MNAQQLITDTESFGDFKVFFNSPEVNNPCFTSEEDGDLFVARTGNTQIPAGSIGVFPISLPFLMPQTFNYTKKENQLWQFKKEQALTELEIPIL